jgi:hypothetical protein
MSTPQQRVRVTHPRTAARRPRPSTVAAEIDADTQLGEVYMRSLMRSQLRLALATTAWLVLTVGSLPILFTVFPSMRSTQWLGIPLPWLLLGGLVYPYLVLLAWVYVRRAERNEQRFGELVDR